MSLIRWCAGFVETNTPQSITYLIAFIVGCAIAFLVVVFALDLRTVNPGVAMVIGGVIVAMGGVLNILLRKGDDTREGLRRDNDS